MDSDNLNKDSAKIFHKRLDFYWKFIALYAVALIAYALLKGSIAGYTITLVLVDPVVMLLALFIAAAFFALIYQTITNRTIIVGEDFITLKSRRREKKYVKEMIRRVSIGKDRKVRISRAPKVIKIWLNNRKKPVKIKPSTYWDERELVQAVSNLKDNIN